MGNEAPCTGFSQEAAGKAAGALPIREGACMTPSQSLLEDAIILATQAHAGQRDKAGEPYILHPLRVMVSCKTEAQRIAAVLHDTVEDTGLEIRLIRKRFGQDIADAVDALTRRDGEAYADFVERCAGNDVAKWVKVADIRDNLCPERLTKIDGETRERLERKYAGALLILAPALSNSPEEKEG